MAGTIYHLRVLIEDEDGINRCLHLRVFRPLPYTGDGPQVQAVKVAATGDELGVLALSIA